MGDDGYIDCLDCGNVSMRIRLSQTHQGVYTH